MIVLQAPAPSGGDDTAALRALLATSRASGEWLEIQFGPGLWQICETGTSPYILELPSNTSLKGLGKGLSIIKAMDATLINKKMIRFTQGGSNFRVSGFTLDGNRSRANLIGGNLDLLYETEIVSGDTIMGAQISDLELLEGPAEAIDLDNSGEVDIWNIDAHDCNGNGVHLSGVSGGPRNSVRHSRFARLSYAREAAGKANASAIDFINGPTLIEGNIIKDCVRGVVGAIGSGLNSDRATAVGNTVEDGSTGQFRQGIYLSGSNGKAVGNTVKITATGGSLSRKGIKASQVIGNTVIGGLVGIEATPPTAVIADNLVTGQQTSGASIQVNGQDGAFTVAILQGNILSCSGGSAINCANAPANVKDLDNKVLAGTVNLGTGAGCVTRALP